MGLEDDMDALLEAGPQGFLNRPDAILSVLTALVGRAKEMSPVKTTVDNVERVLEAQNEQINNAKRAINLLYKQQHQQQQHQVKQHHQLVAPGEQQLVTGSNWREVESVVTPDDAETLKYRGSISDVNGGLMALADRLDRLDRMHDILSERTSINQALLEKMQTFDEASSGSRSKLQAEMERVTTQHQAHTNTLFAVQERVEEIDKARFKLQAAADVHSAQLAQMMKRQPTDDEDNIVTSSALASELDQIRREAKNVEKKFASALSGLMAKVQDQSTAEASCKSEAEGVVHARIQLLEQSLATLQMTIEEQLDEIPSRSRSGTRVPSASPRRNLPDVENLYEIFELNKADVAWAVSGNTTDRLQVLHALPCFAGLALAVANPEAPYSSPLNISPLTSLEYKTNEKQGTTDFRDHSSQHNPHLFLHSSRRVHAFAPSPLKPVEFPLKAEVFNEKDVVREHQGNNESASLKSNNNEHLRVSAAMRTASTPLGASSRALPQLPYSDIFAPASSPLPSTHRTQSHPAGSYVPGGSPPRTPLPGTPTPSRAVVEKIASLVQRVSATLPDPTNSSIDSVESTDDSTPGRGPLQPAAKTHNGRHIPLFKNAAAQMIPSPQTGPGKRTFPVVGLEIVDAAEGLGSGVRVVSVLPNSPADAAGFSAGDRLTSFNGQTTDSRSAFMQAALQHNPGDTVHIDVFPVARFPGHMPSLLSRRLILGSSAVSPRIQRGPAGQGTNAPPCQTILQQAKTDEVVNFASARSTGTVAGLPYFKQRPQQP
ncbi:hypothetical protein DIPPA_25482 [Diplonema papillatum]|nr:hypothetical protein DIPPA_25482 [Diplonema papillatum]